MLLSLLLLSSVVSAASLFEGSAWDEWLTGNQVFRLLQKRTATTATQPVTTQSNTNEIVLPNLFFAPAENSVSAEEYNNLLFQYENTMNYLKKHQRLNLVTRVGITNFKKEDYAFFNLPEPPASAPGLSWLAIEFNTRDYGLFTIDKSKGDVIPNSGVVLTPNSLVKKTGGASHTIKQIGSNVAAPYFTAALLAFQAKNAGQMLTEECGIGQRGFSNLAVKRFGGDGFKPGDDTLRATGKNAQTPTQQEISALRRFGPGGSRVNPGTGYVTQVFDQGSAAERQGCSSKKTQYREERMREMRKNQEARAAVNKEREQISGEENPDLPSEEEAYAAAEIQEEKELQAMAEQHSKEFKAAIDNENKKQYSANLQRASGAWAGTGLKDVEL